MKVVSHMRSGSPCLHLGPNALACSDEFDELYECAYRNQLCLYPALGILSQPWPTKKLQAKLSHYDVLFAWMCILLCVETPPLMAESKEENLRPQNWESEQINGKVEVRKAIGPRSHAGYGVQGLPMHTVYCPCADKVSSSDTAGTGSSWATSRSVDGEGPQGSLLHFRHHRVCLAFSRHLAYPGHCVNTEGMFFAVRGGGTE